MRKKPAKLYDVVIFDYATRTVYSVFGKDLPLRTGSFHTAEKRLETVLPRLNDHYGAAIVPAGKYEKDSVLEEVD